MKSLNGSEIDEYANDIFKILKEVPLFYLNEVLELAKEGRQREGDIDKLDTDSSSDEEEEERIETESEESESESSDDD
mgnify:FL=1